MPGLRHLLVLATMAFTGCVSAPAQPDAAANLNQRQIETLQEMQRAQDNIRRDVESLELVERADVFVGQNEVVVHIYFPANETLSVEDKLRIREDVYAIVTRETGLPREKIRPLAKKHD